MSKGIELDVINGYFDHAHCLICLTRQQTLSDVMKIIKGESAYWINKNKLTTTKFVWQDDYCCKCQRAACTSCEEIYFNAGRAPQRQNL